MKLQASLPENMSFIEKNTLNRTVRYGTVRYGTVRTGQSHSYKVSLVSVYNALKYCHPCLRPYHVENTGSRPITEVKQRRARLVLGWVTAWEYRVQ